MVLKVGFEPTRRSTPVPKTGVAAITPLEHMYWWGWRDSNPHEPGSRDFKSRASAVPPHPHILRDELFVEEREGQITYSTPSARV